MLPQYRAQIDLLLNVLPHVSREECFALNGGTAINLFVRDMPRVSVDIDLTYLSFDDRPTALQSISDALGRIKQRVEKAIPGTTVRGLAPSPGQEAKLLCNLKGAAVKIEVNTVMRGHLWKPRMLEVSQKVQDEFQKFASINVVSQGELFGGKICAALDRQHPRDLFDIHLLFANEGITDEIRIGFMAALLSHTRPMHEIIHPNVQDQRAVFDMRFAGMTLEPFSYQDHEAARGRLIQEVHAFFTDDERAFLLSFKNGNPDWGLLEVDAIEHLPAVQWKLANLRKLKQSNAAKHAAQLKALEQRLARPA